MARGYRAVLELGEREDALRVADRLFHEWLHDKYSLWEAGEQAACNDEGVYRFGTLLSSRGQHLDLVVTKTRETSADKHYSRQLFETVERTQDGEHWVMRLYAMSATKESAYRQVIWVEVVPPRDGKWDAKPPRVVCDLIREGGVFDRDMPLSDALQPINDANQVEELIGWIRDPRRRTAVVVAAPLTDGDTPEALKQESRWHQILAPLTGDSLGCATYFLLTPQVYADYLAKIGEGLGMPQGSLRTFLPGVQPGDLIDARRHRVLTAATLLRGYDEEQGRFHPALARTIARTPREYLWDNGLDKELLQAHKVLDQRRASIPIFHPLEEARDKETRSKEAGEEVPRQEVGAAQPRALLTHNGRKPRTSKRRVLPNVGLVGRCCTKPAAARSGWSDQLRGLIGHVLEFANPRVREDRERAVAQLKKRLEEKTARCIELEGERDHARAETEAAQELLAEAAQESERKLADLRSEVEDLTSHKDDMEIRLLYANEEIRELEQKNRHLAWKATHPDQRESDDRYSEDMLDRPPADMVELYDWMTSDAEHEQVRQHVVFGDPDAMMGEMLRLDELSMRNYAEDFWRYILVLRDYLRAREAGDFANGNVYDFLKAAPDGYRTCSPHRHKSNESDTVKGNARWRRERTFPVPMIVDPSGEITMWTHFAPTHHDRNAPRMYYYADTKKTHKVYIGYIGRHLTNTKTN